MAGWIVRGRLIAGDGRPRIMGVLNVTPDSFSDGARFLDPAAALAHAARLVADGADILDVGGESSRPGAEPVPLAEEMRRVLPVVEALSGSLTCPISIDTAKPEVARRALTSGASIVNDIGGLRDPEMLRVVAETGAGAVLMHMRGEPRTMQADPRYEDVVSEVRDWLARRVDEAEARGVARERIAVDPGIGFGKTIAHNLALLQDIGRFATLGCAVLVGTSRKGFLGTLTGRPLGERMVGSVISSLAALARGADTVRVHDVGAMADALQVWGALMGWRGDDGGRDEPSGDRGG
jgi:dihydropteroate synthase